jgi:threonylcarbamoyladenosine tRNA methylthiotransferase MtaB
MSVAADRPLRVALTVLGCKVNFAEMADLAGKLAAGGCEVVPENEQADVRVLNSCTVTTQADATTRQRLGRLRRMDPDAHLVLTGCSVDANPDAYAHVDSVFANRDKEASPSTCCRWHRNASPPQRTHLRRCDRVRS